MGKNNIASRNDIFIENEISIRKPLILRSECNERLEGSAGWRRLEFRNGFGSLPCLSAIFPADALLFLARHSREDGNPGLLTRHSRENEIQDF